MKANLRVKQEPKDKKEKNVNNFENESLIFEI